jgi:hypothetical protein
MIRISIYCTTGSVEGAIRFPFSLTLGAIAGLRESYSGKLFGLRSTLTVTVTRPWWTFPVKHAAALWLQRPTNAALCAEEASPLPDLTGGTLRLRSSTTTAAAAGTAAGTAAATAGVNARELVIVDCGGRVTLTVDTVCLPLTGHVTGQLTCAGVTTAIDRARLRLIRMETAGAAVDESTVLVQPLFGAQSTDQNDPLRPQGGGIAASLFPPGGGEIELGSTGTSSATAASSGSTDAAAAAAAAATAVVGTAAPIAVQLDLSQAALQPTFVQAAVDAAASGTLATNSTRKGEECALRYLLRLELQDSAGESHWDTLELFLYREALSERVLVATAVAP